MGLLRVTFGIALQLLCFGSVPSDAENHVSEEIKLRFYGGKQKYHMKNYLELPLDKAEQLFSESKGYNRSLPLVLLVHGMAMSADSHFVNGIVKVLKKKKVYETHNIFAVDMPKLMENDLDSKLYFGVLSHVPPTGKILGGFLNFLISMKIITPEKINIIGYSMGTQVAGYIAREVKAKFSKIHYIAGLEPVGPGFHSRLGADLLSLTHVSEDDAKVTHFFHTNSHGFGSHSRDGTADFVFNNGNFQPGCSYSPALNCSHSRAPYLYEEAVLTPKQFVARSCETWHLFSNCQCEGRKTALIGFPPDLTARGTYFLRTQGTSPYGLGKKGSHCDPPGTEERENLPEDSAPAEYQHSIVKGLDIYTKKALHSVGYFYKVLKGEEKNVDADYGKGEDATETDIDTGNAEASGVNSVESIKHPKTTSVKYIIQLRPHDNGHQGNQNNVLNGLDIHGKKALHTAGYFNKVLKEEKKNVDADYGKGEDATETDIDTGNVEVSGVNSVESTKNPKTTSVKYIIQLRPHKNGPQGNQYNVFSPYKFQHTFAPKPKSIKVSHLDINHDRAANKIKEGTSTNMINVKSSKKDTADKKSNVNTPKSTPLEQAGFKVTLQRDEELENGNYASDNVIVFEDTQKLKQRRRGAESQ